VVGGDVTVGEIFELIQVFPILKELYRTLAIGSIVTRIDER